MEQLDYIVPAWNSDKTLKIALESIKKFGYPDRIIIVDRDSKDDTLKIAKEFGCIVIECNKPLGAARRIGARFANSEFVAFVDSDVELNAKWKEIIVCALERRFKDAGVVGGYYSGSLINNISWPLVLDDGGNGAFGCCVTRRDLVLECKEMDRYSSAEDGVFARFLAARNLRWYILPVPLYHHQELTSISTYMRWRWLGAGLRMRDGFRLSHIKKIMGGAIFGIKVKNLDLDYIENFKIRFNYFLGYMNPHKYYEINRNLK